jgi:hypothetical protein
MNNTTRKLSLQLGRYLSVGMLSLYFMPNAFAQAPTAPTQTPSVFKTCAEQVKAAQTAGATPLTRQEFHQQVKACVQPLKQAAQTSCAASSQIATLPTSREGWKELTPAQHQAFGKCMAEKGFRHHRHHHHHHGGQDEQQAAPAPAAPGN